MGELYDICEQEYRRLRPKFEEFLGISLSRVPLFEVEEYMDFLVAKGKLSAGAMWALCTLTAQYAKKEDYGADRDAIIVNEARMRQAGLNPGHVMAHELGHAAHFTADDPESHGIEDTKALMAFVEGFAVYLQTDCIPEQGEELRRYSDEMREALLLTHRTGRLNEMVERFSDPWYKIEGYAFFRSAVEIAGTQDIIFDIIANPPLTMGEIRNPKQYLSRVMPDD